MEKQLQILQAVRSLVVRKRRLWAFRGRLWINHSGFISQLIMFRSQAVVLKENERRNEKTCIQLIFLLVNKSLSLLLLEAKLLQLQTQILILGPHQTCKNALRQYWLVLRADKWWDKQKYGLTAQYIASSNCLPDREWKTKFQKYFTLTISNPIIRTFPCHHNVTADFTICKVAGPSGFRLTG